MMRIIKWWIIAVIGIWGTMAKAQDIQFSQYYNLIHYQNPAFVGTSNAWRAMVHSRLQWPGLDAKYSSTVAAVDYNLSQFNSGLGAMFISDNQGSAAIRTYRFQLQYSYLVPLSSDVMLRAGTSVGMASRVLNNSDLYYPGQFTGSGFDNSQNAPQYSKNYLDLTAGMLLYTQRFWVGLSAAHLNQPNQSFVGSREILPMKLDLISGYKFVLRSNATMRYLENEDEEVWTLSPSVLYKWQGKSDQLDMGLFSIYHMLKLGLWYRGIPIKNYESQTINNEALVFMAGFRFHQFALTYSYDVTLSKLNQYSSNAHELNLTYLLPNPRRSGYKYRRLPCPEFYGLKE